VAQQQAQQQAQDPLLQMQMQELQLKAQDQQRKAAKDQADAALKAAQLQVERERIAEQSNISTAGQKIQAIKAVAELEHDRKKEMTKVGIDMLKTVMASRQQPTKGNQ
jgi:ribosomal protein S11